MTVQDPAGPSLPLCVGTKAVSLHSRIRILLFFLSGFGATLRLAVLSWFAAQLVKGRKTATSSTSFGIFSFLCSSFKSYFHNLASRIYHLSLGFGLIVMNINTESLSEVWLRPPYAFHETASGHCLNLLFFLPLFVLSVERGRWVVLPQFAPSFVGYG